MQQECPYKHNKLHRLPCDYCHHPTKEYIFYCRNCTNWYDVRDVGGDACDWLRLRADSFWLIVGGLILLFVLVSNSFFEPRNANSAPETPTLNEIQD
ncbi:MAG TPA: hypothetical protein VK211_16185 [Kamptonema sp.]|nr:hypothetical protein [Kamptonema sp.]